MQNILSLDTASKKTGYAIYKDGKIIAHGTWKLKPQNRYLELHDFISKAIKKYNITHIVAEDVYKDSDVRKQSAYQVLCECRGILELISQKNAIPIKFINPVIVKGHIWNYTTSRPSHRTMTRAEHKQRMIDCIQHNYGYQLESPTADDEADALGILITYAEQYLNLSLNHQ